MRTGLRLDDYRKLLLEKRKNEPKKINALHEKGERFSSPLGATSTEEIRIFNEYMEQVNFRKITEAAPERKRPLLLKKFFKMKRNQQVEIYSKLGEKTRYSLGKVTAVGRDFVMLTNLKDRIWVPYEQIESANVPTGIPNYDNSHQYFIYDNDLRHKLLTNFGETVAKRDVYIQQFFEETLYTNLRMWSGTWVKVETPSETFFGKIDGTNDQRLMLSMFRRKHDMTMNDVLYVSTLRYTTLLSLLGKRLVNLFQ
ncbi:hypothetical protein DS745_06830 [Anaerobacillus alkaliphilus]|uniref:Uncharacterized protein n=1 Tax=Anaerobacillus alkaliphilus TaxID=1548597 RepID=A0A4Q0VVA5_9BACI|nr:hypothetical protein [Anaerobacillus alkaliphilus]RXJ02413.1 hypothetical protein DS745_06830 [Anaerobacillus alkaliphilus]